MPTADLERSGIVFYGDSKEEKSAEELEKVTKMFDSIPIIEGVEHKPFLLNQVIGKVSKLHIEVQGNKSWLKADKVEWFPENIKDPKVKAAIHNGSEIPGSMFDMVKLSDTKEHIDQVPIHFLIHPDLDPNIRGSKIRFNVKVIPHKEDSTMSKEIELMKEIEALKKQNASKAAEATKLEKQLKDINEQTKSETIKKLVASGTYEEKDLKEKSLADLTLMDSVIAKVAPNALKGRSNAAIQLQQGKSRANDRKGSRHPFFKNLRKYLGKARDYKDSIDPASIPEELF